MKIKTTVGSLRKAFAITSLTLDTKGASSNLYIEANDKSNFIYFYSTNMVTETATKIKAEVTTSGKVLVNPSKLTDGLLGLKEDIAVDLTLTDKVLKVAAGRVKFSLTTSVDVEVLSNRMRAIPSDLKPVAVIPTSQIVEFVKRTVFCIPNDMTGQRARLSAMKLADNDDCEEVLATDGLIAAYVTTSKRHGKQHANGIGQDGLLLPSTAVVPLSQLCAKKKGETVSMILPEKKNKLFFKFADGTHYGSLTMNSGYPNIKGLMGTSTEYTAQISREELKLALGRAGAFTSSLKNTLELEIANRVLTLKVNGDDSLLDQIDLSYVQDKTPAPCKLGMNINHLSNIVAASTSEYLSLGYSNAELTPIVVKDKAEDEDEHMNITYVISGMKVE